MKAETRFFARVSSESCWEWTGGVDPTGYGRFWFDGKMLYAHRWAYESLGGQTIPDGYDVDHLCRNRRCVNPGHLEAVTRRENLMRGETLTAAHADRRDCGFEACPGCKRFRQEDVAALLLAGESDQVAS